MFILISVDAFMCDAQIRSITGTNNVVNMSAECVFLHCIEIHAQGEGVLVELGVALESTTDLSWGNGVSETAEYCKKVPCNSVRPYIDFVPGGSVTDVC